MRHFFLSRPYELLPAVAVLLAAIVFWLRRRPRDPTEAERQRRMYVNRVGRIIEGQVMEIVEHPALAARTPRRGLFRRERPSAKEGNLIQQTLVFYSYRISG